MSKFKVGDKVRILDGSKIKNYTGQWNIFMSDYVGEVHSIAFVRSRNDGRVQYRLNDLLFMWDERGLELVNEKKQKIVITTDGRITKARLYDNEKLVRQAVARCAPDDKFDFNVGAGLAFERLMGTSPTAASLDWDKFAHGKLEVKVNKKNYDAFMKQCEQRNITWHDGQKVNPWELYDGMHPLLQSIIDLADDAPSEHIYISVVGGDLKWDNNHDEGLAEYEFV